MAETPQYFTVMTDAGAALEARALTQGKAVVLTHIAVGDANLQSVTPHAGVTALVHEVYRRPIDSRSTDPVDPKITNLHALLPADVGGWWVNEIGVLGHIEGEEAEVLYAYGNHSRYYKTLPQDGQPLSHELIIPIIQCTDAKLTIQVSDLGYASKTELQQFAENIRLREVQAAAEFIQLSDRVTTGELSRLALEQRHEDELALLREREANRDALIRAGQNRLAALEKAVLGGVTGGNVQTGVTGSLSVQGVPVSEGVTLAAVTIVEDGGIAPDDAMLTLQVEAIEE